MPHSQDAAVTCGKKDYRDKEGTDADSAVAPSSSNNEGEDREDGEIDDDDDEIIHIPFEEKTMQQTTAATAAIKSSSLSSENTYLLGATSDTKFNALHSSSLAVAKTATTLLIYEKGSKGAVNNMTVATIDLTNSSGSSVVCISKLNENAKAKKQQLLEDDHASSIENAIANALKKKGIDPPLTKLLESTMPRQTAAEELSEVRTKNLTGQSRSSRRRKRKKEREREFEREEMRKQQLHQDLAAEAATTPESGSGGSDIDMEYEMLNMRGGSPPPQSSQQQQHSEPFSLPPLLQPSTAARRSAFGIDSYDSGGGDNSSYDSYNSDDDDEERTGCGAGGGCGNRRRRERRKRESRKRRSDRSERRHGNEKRSRRDSIDDEKRQDPRKLELCKFYLMDCCAKRDKCSYMHQDFPCKYYYLGMDCYSNDECMFHHGKPLNDQLRNILLKHLESAPKEILGNFKRISRESAMAQMTRRHEELCKKFGIENNWTPFLNVPVNAPRRGAGGISAVSSASGSVSAGTSTVGVNLLEQQLLVQQPSTSIPSLLDMVINPPILDADENCKKEKKRKTRWADKNTAMTVASGAAANVVSSSNAGQSSAMLVASSSPNIKNIQQMSSSTSPQSGTLPLPSHLELVNLKNLLSAEQIEKLTKLGVSNLEQMNQFTIGQMNEAGLTIADMSEIQMKAAKCAPCYEASNEMTSSVSVPKKIETSKPTMRSTITYPPPVCSGALDVMPTERDTSLSSSNNSNSGGVIMVDYSQYVKDSNINFERDLLDDEEKDEEQLVIDDGDSDPAECVSEVELEKNETQTKSSPISTLTSSLSTAIASDPKSIKASLELNSGAIKNSIFSFSMFNEHKDEARANFFRDIIHNPFKAHKSDDDDSSNSNEEPSYPRDSHSHTSLHGQSVTPEPMTQSQNPDLNSNGNKNNLYVKSSIYDWDPIREQKCELQRNNKTDTDLRSSGLRDIDLRFPFQPVVHFPASSEIDGSYSTHEPISWRRIIVDVPYPSYVELRASCKDLHTLDPRIRRILGLPELSSSTTLPRNVSTSLADTNNLQASTFTPTSPRYVNKSVACDTFTISGNDTLLSYTPKMSTPRGDPRRAATTASASATANLKSATVTLGSSASSASANKQSIEIRNLLQKSEWYKNLGSNNKIMVNQQLALVSTELKKFHQNDASNKIFDVNFIINNVALQQIFTHLGIFIDDNGEVGHIASDDNVICSSNNNNSSNGGIALGGNVLNTSNANVLQLPNMSQPPPNASQQNQMNFLRNPPPSMVASAISQFQTTEAASLVPMNMSIYRQPPPNQRPSLLGMPPMLGGAAGALSNAFNPFVSGIGSGNSFNELNKNVRFLNATNGGAAGAGMLTGFNPYATGQSAGVLPISVQQMQRNFGGGGSRRNNQGGNRRGGNNNGGGGNN